ncbi:hypothetical protein ACLPFM_19835 [Providencia stuartii]
MDRTMHSMCKLVRYRADGLLGIVNQRRGKYIDVWHYPDGQKEIRLNVGVLPYSIYDRPFEVDQGAIVDNSCFLIIAQSDIFYDKSIEYRT